MKPILNTYRAGENRRHFATCWFSTGERNKIVRLRRNLVCTFLLAGTLSMIGFAQTALTDAKTVSAEVITSATFDSVQKRIQILGFDCTRAKDDAGKDDNYLVFRAEGFKVVAFLPSAKTVELDTIFDDVHPTLDSINEWNRDNRYSRAYLAKNGTVVLEDDLDLAVGVTREGFDEFVETFRDSVARWARFALEHNPATLPASAK